MRQNRYLYHWLSHEALLAFHASGVLAPAWRHFLISHDRLVTGISTAAEPMAWSPDEELCREPCLVIDREKVTHPIHALDSSSTYWLTQEINEAQAGGRDIRPVIEKRQRMNAIMRGTPDEFFIEGALEWGHIVAIGLEENSEASARAASVASSRNLPLVDMRGWTVGYPGYLETDDIIDEAIAGKGTTYGY